MLTILKKQTYTFFNKGAMLDFNSSLERYNSNDYRTPFIFILILRTGEQNEMSKARRLLVIQREGKPRRDLRSIFIKINITSLLVVIFTSGFHQMKGKIAGTSYMSI